MIPSRPDEAVVNPARVRSAPELGPVGILVSNDADRREICRRLDISEGGRALMMSRVSLSGQGAGGVAMAGPYIGAPYAVLLLETLIAWGWRQILVMGWCGGIAPDLTAGDLILPSAAIRDEGTSAHYPLEGPRHGTAEPSRPLTDRLGRHLDSGGIVYRRGTIWTTDALFRETRRAVAAHQADGVLGVEMELSALFTVARFRGVEVAALLVVSDELGSLDWRPGFHRPRFRDRRRVACDAVAGCAGDLAARTTTG